MVDVCMTEAQAKRWGLKDATAEEKKNFLIQRRRENELRKRNIELDTIVMSQAIDHMESYIDHKGKKNIKEGLESLLYTDRAELSNTTGLESRMLAINARAHNRLFDMMDELRPTLLDTAKGSVGMKTGKRAENLMVHAIYGDAKGDVKFTKFAKSWADLIEDLRLRFNRAGGDIGKIDDWHLPQHHDEYMIGQAGYDKWYEDIAPLLDLEGMDINPQNAKSLLKRSYDNIVSGGLTKLEPGQYLGNSKVSNRHQESRFFKFKDAESWLKYQSDYTDGTIYSSMMDHVTMISNEIGLMENLGTNPDRSFDILSQIVNKEMGDRNASDFAKKAYANLAGKTNPVNRKFADRSQMARNVTLGLKLPAAMLSALPDTLFNVMTARYNGIPAGKVMTRFISTFSHNSKADRKLASQVWFPMEHMIDEAHAASRYADVTGQGASAHFVSTVMRASGLAPWTVAGKQAFHIEFMGALANHLDDANLQRTLTRYGITPEDVALIRASKKLEIEGGTYLDPETLPQGVAERVVAMVISETKYAVPESDVLVKAVLNQGSRKGEVGGEIIRAVTMLKTFPATIIANHWARAKYGGGGHNWSHRIGYTANMIVGTWILGMAVLQMKEITKGREPISFDNPELWKKAGIQGGIFSLFGDIYNLEARKYGQSFADFLVGPLGGEFNKLLWKGILGTMDDMKAGETDAMALAKSVIGEIPNYVPGQFWYTKLALDRAILDSMRKFGDPQWELKQQQKEVERYKEFGNERLY